MPEDRTPIPVRPTRNILNGPTSVTKGVTVKMPETYATRTVRSFRSPSIIRPPTVIVAGVPYDTFADAYGSGGGPQDEGADSKEMSLGTKLLIAGVVLVAGYYIFKK